MNTEQNLQFFYLLENQMQTFPTPEEPSLGEQGYVTICTTLQGSS